MKLCSSGHRGVHFYLEWKQNLSTIFPTTEVLQEEVYLAYQMVLGYSPCYWQYKAALSFLEVNEKDWSNLLGNWKTISYQGELVVELAEWYFL